jgi:hypothetical protein
MGALHRYPFLLVDRVVEVEYGKYAVGYKNVTINDNFFTGHFPDRPIMPGELAAAQCPYVDMYDAVCGGVLLDSACCPTCLGMHLRRVCMPHAPCCMPRRCCLLEAVRAVALQACCRWRPWPSWQASSCWTPTMRRARGCSSSAALRAAGSGSQWFLATPWCAAVH